MHCVLYFSYIAVANRASLAVATRLPNVFVVGLPEPVLFLPWSIASFRWLEQDFNRDFCFYITQL